MFEMYRLIKFYITENRRIVKYNIDVVATTHHSRTNDLTTSKALQWAIK